jgi:PAS domain S-box-containing protein
MNKLLARQINKYLDGLDYPREALEPLFQAISDAYDNFEEDRHLIERALDLSSEELTETNQKLRREINDRKEAENTLLEHKQRLDTILSTLLTGVLVVNSKTHEIVDVNTLAATMIRLGKEEIIGKVCHKFICPAEEGKCPITDLGQTIDKSERILLRQDGGTLPILKNVAEVNWQGHKYLIESFIDITEQKKAVEELQKAEEKYRMLFEGALDAIFVADAQTGILIDCNAAGTKLVGREKTELIGQSHRILHPVEEGSEEFNETFRKHLTEETGKSLETQVISKSGELREVAIKARLLEIEGKKVLQGIFRDITDRKRAEEKLKSINEKLANSNQQLQEFIYAASHDLREPVRKVLAFGELLASSLPEKLDGNARENFDFMIEGSQRIWQLVENLLDYSRVLTKNPVLRDVNLNMMIEHFRNSKMSNCIQETGGTLLIQNELPIVKCDPTQIYLLVQNLLTNAFKYHRKAVPPIVTIRTIDLENENVRVEVQDNGIGIKKEQLENIFRMFRRMHSRQEYEGTGIGLTLCKRIIEKHNCQIGVESKYGECSTFWFTMPLSEKQKIKPTEAAASISR